MGTKTLAVLVTIALSVVGVLGDYFLKLASASAAPAGDFVLSWFRALRLDWIRLGVRNETSEAHYHKRPLFRLAGAAAYRDRSGVLSLNTKPALLERACSNCMA